ncbi:hypothetical protein [Goodfellowiella coeruleoviolacea]|uniref:hypothetical protein n=1 Tax=Goodfellowiella coeruleoviolacea TaxID=334858 RepID=UPI0020A3E41F|nr:hypothetical protein [Goodfellowiella coeruleoviolacea]
MRVYQRGGLVAERDVYPHLRVTVPGLTELVFNQSAEDHGGHPEADGRYAGMSEDAVWAVLAPDVDETARDDPDAIGVGVDWAGLDLPGLVSPVLPPGAEIVRHDRTFRYGRNSCSG